MKITRRQLRQIIKEEIDMLNEGRKPWFDENKEMADILRPIVAKALNSFGAPEDSARSRRSPSGEWLHWSFTSKELPEWKHSVSLKFDTKKIPKKEVEKIEFEPMVITGDKPTQPE